MKQIIKVFSFRGNGKGTVGLAAMPIRLLPLQNVGTCSWTVYNIFRDHLGTITHLKTGSAISEYSFDAWGRRRDKDTWSYTLDSEPALFADRGFTAHEYLEDFKLYNMNGRLYDPVVGRFLNAHLAKYCSRFRCFLFR